MSDGQQSLFNEAIAIMDDQAWIWNLTQQALSNHLKHFIRLPSDVPIRNSWQRFKSAPVLIIHWESAKRSGGATLEEILSIDPSFDIGNRVIVLTDNPIREDVVYFGELGVSRILRIRNREKDLAESALELSEQIRKALYEHSEDGEAWNHLLKSLDHLTADVADEKLKSLEDKLMKLQKSPTPTARDLDARASIMFARKLNTNAEECWLKAIEKNPNYYRAYNKLVNFYRSTGRLQESMALMQRLNQLNKNCVARHVAMGEVSMELGDDQKAEHHFATAISRDEHCSGALNGIAELRFKQGELDASRACLEKSNLAYRMAAKLNKMGITMVQAGRYAEALEHYSKAQYVLPQQEKGPQLFFNIGLCYARWGKHSTAQEFLKLALIKEPNYKKAEKLLEQITQIQQRASA